MLIVEHFERDAKNPARSGANRTLGLIETPMAAPDGGIKSCLSLLTRCVTPRPGGSLVGIQERGSLGSQCAIPHADGIMDRVEPGRPLPSLVRTHEAVEEERT